MSKELCKRIERQTITHRCSYLAVMKRFLERYKGPKIVAGSRPLSFGCCDAEKPVFPQIELQIPKYAQKKSSPKATVGDPRITTFDL